MLTPQIVDDGSKPPPLRFANLVHVVDGPSLNQGFAGPIDLRPVAVPVISHVLFALYEF